MVVQGVNIEILPPEGEVKRLGHPITFKNAEQVELEHRIKCAWATFTNHRQELKSPKCPLRDRLKLFDAKKKVTSLFYASGTWTMTKEMKKKLQTTQRRMMRMITQTNRKTGTGHAAAHAASVDDTADVELHDPDSEPVDHTTEHDNQDFNEQKRKEPRRR